MRLRGSVCLDCPEKIAGREERARFARADIICIEYSMSDDGTRGFTLCNIRYYRRLLDEQPNQHGN